MLRSCNSVAILSSKIFLPKEEIMEGRCQFWLPKKRRYCANAPLYASSFCGNHTPRSDGQWIPCPVDPSHSVLDKNLRGHAKRCPLVKQIQSLSLQPYYRKGINGGRDESAEKDEEADVSSETKRNSVHNMSVTQFIELLSKIRTVHGALRKDIRDSYKMPEACNLWIKREVDRKLPYQEKHVMQQASILGNLEDFGVLKNSHHASMRGLFDFPMLRENQNDVAAVIEFGAGRGYLTQMLADCYGINEVFLVERKSYKHKADRSLRQKESLVLERLRIDIEDLNLNAVESLRGIPYLAIGKHLCGPATDLTLRCCLPEHHERDNGLQKTVCHDHRGLAIATCCHHLCQWKHYINKTYMWNIGISKEDFHAISWFTSWAVDADHGSELCYVDCESEMQSIAENKCGEDAKGVEEILRNMNAVERALLGFMCKDIIDMGRLMWIKERGMEAELVKSGRILGDSISINSLNSS
ncbi:hypothetical protein Nepgr_004082 [Nepenthes gracilis]|uniref:tRNA:m(4)X modification enzyme TRM13 n=1 Tax=Nepenthes gracilis TaxID=150966 RepID=A0AAD3S0P1_NEPGR|nr:hypothetical protein Nepgr_004082 [Nepenthes gracilis]